MTLLSKTTNSLVKGKIKIGSADKGLTGNTYGTYAFPQSSKENSFSALHPTTGKLKTAFLIRYNRSVYQHNLYQRKKHKENQNRHSPSLVRPISIRPQASLLPAQNIRISMLCTRLTSAYQPRLLPAQSTTEYVEYMKYIEHMGYTQ